MGSTSPPILYEDEQYQIRAVKSTDEFKGVWWSFMQGLGWNRGYYDLETYMNPSRGSGMLILIDKSENKPVGHVSAVINCNDTGWIAMFIIDAAHRGKGMGRELFKAGMADAKKAGVKILGLDAVREQKAAYERRGFIESPLGVVKLMMRPLVAKEALRKDGGITSVPDRSIVNIREVPLKLLVSHELKYTGFKRPELWSQEHMFRRPDVFGIGPIYAEDAACANAVLVAAMKDAKVGMIKDIPLPNEPISDLSEAEVTEKATLVTEVWCGNPEAEKIFDDLGWKDVGVEYHRMWVDSKATEQGTKGGLAQKGVFAIFDATVG